MNKISGALLGCALGVSLCAGVSIVTKGSKVESKPVEAKAEKVEPVRLSKGTPIKPSGSGTSSDPFRIGTVEELEWFRDDNNSQSKASNRKKCAKLINDIDLQGSSENIWVSIGNAENRDFRGTFDGDGYTIYNFYQDGSTAEYSGLFGYLTGGTVKNLSMRGYLSTTKYGGSFVGYAFDGSVISNCINYIDVHADGMGAGIAYGAKGTTFSRCINYGHITGGELAGIMNNGNTGNRFEYCVNYGRIEGQGQAGGIVGSTSTSNSFSNNYNVGQITSTATKWATVGGICAETTNGSFRTNHNVGSVTQASGTYNYKGAIVGKYNAPTGDVDGQYNYYRTGSCTGDSANATAIAVDGYTTQANFEEFDFDSIWKMGPEYPVLRYQFSSGNGSANNPYIVKSLEDLEHVADDLSASYKLGHGINTFGDESHTWTPIGNEVTPFLGSFDGNGYTISNLYIKNTVDNADPVGLFGTTAANSTVKNVKVEGTVINENTTNNIKNATGAVVGHAEGKIYKCEVDADVTGQYRVGGVVGVLGNSESSYTQAAIPSVEQCSNKGSVSVQNSMAGGLVGVSYGPISESYNVANVTGLGESSEQVGGIVGVMNNPNSSAVSGLIHCHNQGEVSAYRFIGSIVGQNYANISSTYYLEKTSIAKIGGTTAVNGGVGANGLPTDENTTHLTADEAKEPSSYEGWDFDNIWMKGRAPYPVLFDAVEQTILLIENIGEVTLTPECKGKIDAARSAYNALDASFRNEVSNYSTLTDAESKYASLVKVNEVQTLIDNLGEVEYSDSYAQKLSNIISKYDALTNDEKGQITGYEDVENKQASYNEIDDTVAKIEAIGEVTVESGEVIKEARDAFNALDEAEKATIPTYEEILVDAEKTYHNLTADKSSPVGAIVGGIIGGIIFLFILAYVLLMFVFNKWIKKEDKAVRVLPFSLGKKEDKLRVLAFPCKFEYRLESEIYKSKEDALK